MEIETDSGETGTSLTHSMVSFCKHTDMWMGILLSWIKHVFRGYHVWNISLTYGVDLSIFYFSWGSIQI